MSLRFVKAVNALREQQRGAPVDVQSEMEIAIGILIGKRPGVDDKYDAMLLKLTRLVGQYQDYQAQLESWIEGSEFILPRAKLKARLAVINKVIQDLKWVEARNKDLIALAK